MKINVRVIAGARQNLIKEEGEMLKIYLTAPAVDGKANKALIERLAEHFGVKKYQIELTKGLKSSSKTIIINI